MSEPEQAVTISVDKITLAIQDMEACKLFYGLTLGIEFSPLEIQNFTLYSAITPGFELLLCPRELAQVDNSITNNTVQVRIRVSDIQNTFDKAIRHGGQEIQPPQKAGEIILAGIRDPDGNSLELVQRG